MSRITFTDAMTHTARVSAVIALLFSAGLSLKAQILPLTFSSGK